MKVVKRMFIFKPHFTFLKVVSTLKIIRTDVLRGPDPSATLPQVSYVALMQL